MDTRLDGRRALVTGGSEGLGQAAALELVDSGARVAIVSRSKDKLAQALAELHARHGAECAIAIDCDVRRAADLERAWRATEAAFGGVDIIVNNAGASAHGRIDTLSDDAWQQDLDLKFFPVVRLARLALPGMRARKWGRIINILNTLARAPRANTAPTSVSRAAGLALTKVMAHECAPDNVLVNAIMIGHIKSRQWNRFHARENPDLAFDDYLAKKGREIPIGRLGEAADFGNLVCFLCSPAADYITGTAINLDGGLSPVP